ncbi:InlB B-repeat-containing protein [Candidatus Saccharibacteria bacterium]|nr:InlB B-repeat-containing protein [Candidatus Saccharibacteria bacterium]
MEKKFIGFLASLIGITFFAGIVLASSSSHAASSVTANASVIIPDACTMTGTLDEAHTATIPNGTIRPAIGKTTFNVVCNDPNGFAIYAVGYSNQEYGNTKLLATVGGTLAPTYDISTGATTTGNSQWAMMLTPVTTNVTAQNGYGSYSVIPTTYTKIAQFPNSTTVSGAEAEVTYRAYIAGNQPAGTYNGKVKYTMVHPNTETPLQPVPCVANTICYNANGRNVVGTMGQQTESEGESLVDLTRASLLASNYSREGYGFAGWNTKYDYTGDFYGPQEEIELPNDMSHGLALYAIWLPSNGYLQDWNRNTNDCERLEIASFDSSTGTIVKTLDSVIALTDKRDGQTYSVARLADGNCWMTENLRLNNNTDSPNWGDNGLSEGFEGVFMGLAEAENNRNALVYDTTANSLYSTSNITGSNVSFRFPRYNNINTTSIASYPTDDSNSTIYSYGNYYTWAAAKASTEDASTTGSSICPCGWSLPSGGQSIESFSFGALSVALGGPTDGGSTTGYDDSHLMSTRFRSFPQNYVLSGYGGNSNFNGTIGYYWSSTRYSSNYAYYFHFDRYINSFDPGTVRTNKTNLYTIRCLFRPK